MNSGVKRIISAKNDLIKYRGSLIQRIIDCSNILTSIYINLYIYRYLNSFQILPIVTVVLIIFQNVLRNMKLL